MPEFGDPLCIPRFEVEGSLDQNAILLHNSAFASAFCKRLNLNVFEKIYWLAANLKPEDVQIEKTGHKRQYADIRTDPLRAAHSQLSDGYSLIVNFAERYDPFLAKVSAAFSDEYSAVCNIALFLAPPNSAAFPTHFDHLDVFAVQVEGSKNWQYGDHTELPAFKNNFAFDEDKNYSPSQVTLNQSDALYLPRGIPHNVSTSGQYSLHATIGLNPIKSRDVINKYVDVITSSNIELRRQYKSVSSDDSLVLEELLGSYSNPYVNKKAHSYLRAELVSKLKQSPSNRLKDILEPVGLIDKTTPLRRKKGFPCEVVLSPDTNSAYISFPGLNDRRVYQGDNFLTFPPTMLIILEFIRDCNSSFTIRNLPSEYDFDSKLLVVERLLEEGLLEFDE